MFGGELGEMRESSFFAKNDLSHFYLSKQRRKIVRYSRRDFVEESSEIFLDDKVRR